jgi:5'-nucleotidase
MRGRRFVLLAVTGLLLASGCRYFPQAVRGSSAVPADLPWWCDDGTVTLSPADCQTLSFELDLTEIAVEGNWSAAGVVDAGIVPDPYEEGIGVRFSTSGPSSTFNPATPDSFLYTDETSGARIAGVEWNVESVTEPDGFAGGLDQWSGPVEGVWTLRLFLARPFENQADPFAPTHPCLAAGGPILDLADPCYSATHPEPMQILVTNDDGYGAHGIDALVQGLLTVDGVEVTVVAPATNQSGTGETVTPGGVTSVAATMLSGYPARAVSGTPADSVIHALTVLGENPDLVVSGINEGQNIGPVVDFSGTVGAARRAVRYGVHAIATSQGLGSPPDWPAGVAATLRWLEAYRLGEAGPPHQEVLNLNVPTCTSGAIRGDAVVPTASAFNGRPFNPSNCESTVTELADDIDAFIHGFVAVADAGL